MDEMMARPAPRRSAELQRQPPTQAPRSKRFKSEKYSHVHYFEKTDQWGAWLSGRAQMLSGGKRLYFLGTHLTETLAARSQDRALLKLENVADRSMSPPIKLNFPREADYDEDERLRDTLSRAGFFKLLRKETDASDIQKSDCLRKLLAREGFLRNETDHEDEGGEHDSPDEGSSDVVPQRLTSVEHGLHGTESEAAGGNGAAIVPVNIAGPLASIAPAVIPSALISGNGKRQASTKVLQSSDEYKVNDEKETNDGLFLLLAAAEQLQ